MYEKEKGKSHKTLHPEYSPLHLQRSIEGQRMYIKFTDCSRSIRGSSRLFESRFEAEMGRASAYPLATTAGVRLPSAATVNGFYRRRDRSAAADKHGVG